MIAVQVLAQVLDCLQELVQAYDLILETGYMFYKAIGCLLIYGLLYIDVANLDLFQTNSLPCNKLLQT